MKKSFLYVSRYMSKWLFVATLVGLGGGLSAVALRRVIGAIEMISFGLPIWIAPAVGGALAVLIFRWDRRAQGFGTDRYIYAINCRAGYMRFKTMFSKLLATGATLGFRGSGGVEGPMLVIGGSLANGVAHLPLIRKFFSEDDFRILTICGAAGAIGAIFRSPLGGGIFVVEVLYRSSLHYSDLFPAVLSSTMGFVIFSMLDTGVPLFAIPDYLPSPTNVPWFVVASIISGVLALIFMVFFQWFRNLIGSMSLLIRPVIGGILTGLVLMVIPEVSGTGTGVIQELITSPQPLIFLAFLLAGKILATTFTVGSGGSAGMVIPALFIGALAGNGLAGFVANGNPQLTASVVIAGMAASLAAMANVPIAAAVMLIEMVGLRIGVPATLGSVIGYSLGRSKVIYGTTSRQELEFEEGREFRKKDRNLSEH